MDRQRESAETDRQPASATMKRQRASAPRKRQPASATMKRQRACAAVTRERSSAGQQPAERWLLLVLTFLGPFLIQLSFPRALPAQKKTQWVLSTTMGYTGLGCAAGYLIARQTLGEQDRFFGEEGVDILTVMGACGAGGTVGLRLGLRVDSLLGRGLEPKPGTRRGVQFGTVLTGATLATLISFIHLGMTEDDETRIVATYALSGAAVGALAQLSLNRYLAPRLSPPALELGRGPEGGVAFGLRFRFPGAHPRGPPRSGPYSSTRGSPW